MRWVSQLCRHPPESSLTDTLPRVEGKWPREHAPRSMMTRQSLQRPLQTLPPAAINVTKKHDGLENCPEKRRWEPS
ncbi:hypothetical protein C0Q70_04000 [Pomacea canaliculata]|uniref:Uncharacterized protein n=1 Tax=Pomacea canaliculata TaxID=400727 RepID=A0A2T7PUE8_POMCA|nr:hypothetical protein C0Q70_04000 [Pomacea canaliculata]